MDEGRATTLCATEPIAEEKFLKIGDEKGPGPREAKAGDDVDGKRPCRAYPRVCGGISFSTPPSRIFIGLSPRVRGNPVYLLSQLDAARPIPACEGESKRPTLRPPFSWAYPRVCGGIRLPEGVTSYSYGLSPRVRGNLPRGLFGCLKLRPIPACAGESFGTSASVFHTTAYPRVCGGIGGQSRHQGNDSGLSPRVRGKRIQMQSSIREERPIPACAGET